jgi:hypothetical protein
LCAPNKREKAAAGPPPLSPEQALDRRRDAEQVTVVAVAGD